MLRSLKHIKGYSLRAPDGKIGALDDFYFDDATWVVRYAVADTRKWLPGRLVLLSPASLGEPDWADRSVPVSLTTEQIKAGPSASSDRPVSRQLERDLATAFGWPVYWETAGGGLVPTTHPLAAAVGDPRLRSASEVTGYAIEADDGAIGHVEDFILDVEKWHLRYIVIDTKNWLPGKKVLIKPDWAEEVRWDEKQVRVALNKQAIKDAPAYDPAVPVNSEYELRLSDYFGRPVASI